MRGDLEAYVICLLCPSPAVADSLCVSCGAKLWAAEKWRDNPTEAALYRAIMIGGGRCTREQLERVQAITERIRNTLEAHMFLVDYHSAMAAHLKGKS